MYSRWLNWNHRLRLSLLCTVTVSAALAFVFIVVALLVRGQAENRRFVELERGIRQISGEWGSPESLSEVKEDFPGLEVAVYRADGPLVASTAKSPPHLVSGRVLKDGLLIYGLQVGSNVFVGESSWGETEVGLRQLSLVLAALWLPLTFLTAAVSWYGGGLVLRPVKELVASAEMLSGTTDGLMLTTTDRAEFASLARSLNQLIERVRHAGSLQEQFASDAAHELRTPLALMRTRVEANLKRERTSEEHVASQVALLRQIERLTSIVETLLLSARRPEQASGVTSFDAAVQRSVEEWVELREWPPDRLLLELAPCVARVSQEEIAIIVRNLLDNGATHCPAGERLEVRVKGDDTWVSLTVRDFGPGLSSEEMSNAFVRFYRSDEGRSRKDGGAGIGLAVVKRIVESHEGAVRFVPVERGAEVLVTFPSSGSPPHFGS